MKNFTESNFLPRRRDHSLPYVVGIGKQLEIMCIPPESYPAATVAWQRDARSLSALGRVRAVNGTLNIERAERDDAGKYECVATGMAGSKVGVVSVSTTGEFFGCFFIFFHFVCVCVE